MKVVEIIGGLYMNLSNEQYAFYKGMVRHCRKNSIDRIPINSLNDKQRTVAQRLVDSHVLDRRNGEYIIRTEVL